MNTVISNIKKGFRIKSDAKRIYGALQKQGTNTLGEKHYATNFQEPHG